MKYLPLLFLPLFFLFLAGCPYTSSPTQPQVNDTLSIAPVSVTGSVTGAGTFYDYSRPSTVAGTSYSYTFTNFSFGSTGGTWTFSDYAHDTLGFAVTFSGTSGPVTFNYQLDTLSGTGVANPGFNSGQISF